MITYPVGLLGKKGSLIPTDGLIGEWLFLNNLNDTSGQGNNGNPHNSPTYANDRHSIANSALSLDGINQYVSIDYSTSLLLTGAFSISVWFNGVVNNASHVGIGNFNNSGARGWQIGINNQDLRCYLPDSATSFITIGPFGLISGYRHIVLIYSPNNFIRLYRDNSLLDELTISIPASLYANTNGILFGTRYPIGSYPYFNGIIDDIRIYNRVLTTDEITALYNE